MSEYELRREESASWPSVYARSLWSGEGTPEDGTGGERDRAKRRSRTAVLEREDEAEKGDNEKGMSDEEIEEFERQFGVEYDPYYGGFRKLCSASRMLFAILWNVVFQHQTNRTRRMSFQRESTRKTSRTAIGGTRTGRCSTRTKTQGSFSDRGAGRVRGSSGT